MTTKTRFSSLFGGAHRTLEDETKPFLILAPMVRASLLPLRLLSLKFGASTVFSEELIAKKLKNCIRIENEKLGTIDYVIRNEERGKDFLVFQTCEYEKGKNILQIGAAEPTEAVQAALVVARDVSGIDLNMGCPQHFSLSGGMGAALLSKPCVAADIVKGIRAALPSELSVSCKIRLLAEPKDTISLIQTLEKAGANCVTIHARHIKERPRDRARWEELEEIIQAVSPSLPIIVNGDCFTYPDSMNILKSAPHASGVMVARGAIADVKKAFGTESLSCVNTVHAYLAASELCDIHFSNSKWYLSQILRYREDMVREPKTHLYEGIAKSKSPQELLRTFDINASLVTRNECWNGAAPINEHDRWESALDIALSKLNITSSPSSSSKTADSEETEHKRVKTMNE